MATSLEGSKKLNGVNKRFNSCTSPEILVKIGPLDSGLPGLESRPLKNIKYNKEKILAKYIAFPASLLSGLINNLNIAILTALSLQLGAVPGESITSEMFYLLRLHHRA